MVISLQELIEKHLEIIDNPETSDKDRHEAYIKIFSDSRLVVADLFEEVLNRIEWGEEDDAEVPHLEQKLRNYARLRGDLLIALKEKGIIPVEPTITVQAR